MTEAEFWSKLAKLLDEIIFSYADIKTRRLAHALAQKAEELNRW